MAPTPRGPDPDRAEFSVERERLIVEARRLIADAGDGQALEEAAALRFGEIERRLEELADERDERPAVVDPTRPQRTFVSATAGMRHTSTDPFAAFGAHPGVASLLPSREDTVRLHLAVRDRQPLAVGTAPLQFAAVTTTDSGFPVQYIEAPPLAPRRLAEFARLAAEDVGIGGRATYPIFAPGQADVVVEAAAKPEYDGISAASVVPMVIAVWTEMTMQVGGIMGFESMLRSKLSALVARREDQLLLATAAATPNIQTHVAPAAETYADSLLTAAALVSASDMGADADVAVVNPADVPIIFASSVGITGESPDSRFRLTLHGLRCYVSAAQAAGTALVGSWAAASRLVVGLGPTFAVDPYSGFKNNIVTLRLEEALGLAVHEPSAFVAVTFDDGV